MRLLRIIHNCCTGACRTCCLHLTSPLRHIPDYFSHHQQSGVIFASPNVPDYSGVHSQKRHRLAASCGLYRLAASCHQVAASLLTSSSCSKSVRIRLAATRYLQTCCKLLQQLAASLWTSSLDKSVVSTCSKSDERINADASCENQTCCKLIFQICCKLFKQLAASLR